MTSKKSICDKFANEFAMYCDIFATTKVAAMTHVHGAGTNLMLPYGRAESEPAFRMAKNPKRTRLPGANQNIYCDAYH
jgi:hypothetical protein